MMEREHGLRTPLCALLGCRYPILQAGMGGVARSEFVAAVTEAGGYGFLGMVRETPDLISQQIDAVRARTVQADWDEAAVDSASIHFFNLGQGVGRLVRLTFQHAYADRGQ